MSSVDSIPPPPAPPPAAPAAPLPAKRLILRNVSWAMLGKTVQVSTSLLVGILVARHLGPEQYGLMSYVVSYVGLFTFLAVFGLDDIEIREMAKGARPRDVVMGTAFGLRLGFGLLSTLLVLLATQLSGVEGESRGLIALYALSMPLMAFNVIRNQFTALVLNSPVVKSEIVRHLTGAALKGVLLLLRAPLLWFVAALAFDFLLLASGYVRAYHRHEGRIRRWRFHPETARYLLRQAFPLLLSSAAVVIYQNIDQVMIGHLLDKASVGYFSTAVRFVSLTLFLPIVFSQTVSPLLVRIRERSEEEYRRQAQRFTNVMFWGSLLLAATVGAGADPLIRLTFGPAYLDAIPVLRILSFKVVFMALSASSNRLLVIEHKQRWMSIRNLCGCLTCILLNAWLIPAMGVRGSAWATLATFFVVGSLSNLLVPSYRFLLGIQFRAVWRGWKDLAEAQSLFR